MSETILVAERLSRNFGGIQAIDDLSFALNEGEIVALIGPNGAGKTTLVNLLTGVVRPSSGHIRFQGEDVTAQRPFEAARRGLARTFQIVQPFPEMTVLENVAAGCAVRRRAGERRGRDGRWRASNSNSWGSRSLPTGPPSALTLAGRKRLELAKSMAMQPKVLMLDEVNAGLNAQRDRRRAAADPADRRTGRDHPRHRASDEGRAVARAARAGASPRPARSPRAAPTRSCATSASSRPIWARSSRAVSRRRPPMAEPILTVEGLAAGYGDVRVLWDISLAVAAGEITCIVGSNGAGKTTLLRTISGLVPAASGRIAFAGRGHDGACRRPDPWPAASRMCRRGGGCSAGLNVHDNLLLGAYLRQGRRRGAARPRLRVHAVSDPARNVRSRTRRRCRAASSRCARSDAGSCRGRSF